MEALNHLKPGDRVQVFDYSRGTPKGGWDGTVVKVGTKLLTVEYRYREDKFRKENGMINGTQYGYGVYVRTPEEVEKSERRDRAVVRLKEFGLEFSMYGSSDLTIEKIEAVIKVLEDPQYD